MKIEDLKKGCLVHIPKSESERMTGPGLFLGIHQTPEERPFTGGVALVLYRQRVEKVMINGLELF